MNNAATKKNRSLVDADVEETPPEDQEAAPPAEKEDDGILEIERPEKPEGKRGVAPRVTAPLAQMAVTEDIELKTYLQSLGLGGKLRILVKRTQPKMWKGLKVDGQVGVYDEPIDEEFVGMTHGGGDYMLTVQKPAPNGNGWRYAGARAIHIAGDPRTDDVFRNSGEAAAPQVAAQSTAVVDRAFAAMERQVERAERAGGPDLGMFKMMLEPIQRQLEQQAAVLRDKDAQLAAAQTRAAAPAPVDSFREKFMEAMLDGDSARLTTLREQHASELRQLKANEVELEKRLRDSFERDRQNLSMSHERELNALRSSYDMKCAAQETMHATMKALMDGEIRRLQADLTESKSEVVALRLKKEKSIIEQATEFAAIKEAIGDITGDGDKEEKSGWEKAAEVGLQIPAVQNLIAKIGGGADPNEAAKAHALATAQAQARQPRLARGPGGHLYQVTAGQAPRIVRRAPAPPPGAVAAVPDIAPTTIKVAVDFLENAYRNNHDPEQVATSVRSMIPPEVFAAIRERGVDGFLADVAKLDGASPLASQGGRNWSRKVGKALVGG